MLSVASVTWLQTKYKRSISETYINTEKAHVNCDFTKVKLHDKPALLVKYQCALKKLIDA